ncbi:hypothetical protein HY797_04495 [Candidatus Falkowbacteria bacterium]|nr:hypothetical protein [Candidatus Falkowbacteria bacterium]
MLKSFPKIITIFFLTIFIFQLACLIFLFTIPVASQAADPIKFTPQVQGLDYTFNASDTGTGNIARYVRAIYKYAIGIVGILAAVVLMIGGVMWIVAGGSSTMIGEAKAWIGASLTGLVLALLSYLILATVNPALVNFKTSGIQKVTELTISETCQATTTTDWNYPCSSLSGNNWESRDTSKCKDYNYQTNNVCCCKENELTPTIVDTTKKHKGCVTEAMGSNFQRMCKDVPGEGNNECATDQDCIDNQSVCCLQNYNIWGYCPVCFTGYGKCEILTNTACNAISGATAYPNSTCQDQTGTLGYIKECKIK